MARTKSIEPEPTFLGVGCCGPKPEHAAQLRNEAESRLLLSRFYEMDRKDQLVMAAMVTELVKNRDD